MARKNNPRRVLPAKPSRWESASLGNKIALISLVVAIIGLPLAYFLGNPSRAKDSRELELLKNQGQVPSDPGCGFPSYFVRDTLYVLITRFEDTQEEGAGNPYGKGIERRIDILSDSLRLPIVFCYRKDLSPNQRRDADLLRDKFHADLVIWGKLKNSSSECKSDGFCLQFEPSDTLIYYAGGSISKPKLDDYQVGVAADNLEKELIRMGKEVFDDWLVGMFNLKIGKRKPELFIIPEGWDNQKKADAYFAKGQAWMMLRRNKEALADFDHGLALGGYHSYILINRAALNMRLGNLKKSIADLDMVITRDSTIEAAYFNRGAAKAGMEMYEEALADYNKCILLGYRDEGIFLNRAAVYRLLGRHEEAMKDWSQVLALNPKNADAYSDRSRSKSKLGRHKEALEDLDIAIELNPRHALSYIMRAWIRKKFGRDEGAISDYDMALSLDPYLSAKSDVYRLRNESRRNLEKEQQKYQRGASVLFGAFMILYFWKFKTINHIFSFLYQSLKKLHHRP